MRKLLRAWGCVLGCVLAVWGGQAKAQDQSPQRSVILIGLDGFRWDALSRADTPNFDALIAQGVHARTMTPVFPTLSYPNLYTLVSGLYPEHHGFVSNAPFDQGDAQAFTPVGFTQERWWGGEPIWITAEKQGLKTAITSWIAGEVEFDGVRPTYWHSYMDIKTRLYAERVDLVLSYLDLPVDERPRFVTLYHDAVDNNAHEYGVGSEQERAAITRMDAMLGYLIAGLQARGLSDSVNIIIVSDHGMTNLGPDQTIYLDDYIDLSDVHASALSLGSTAFIWPKTGDRDGLYAQLKAAHPHMDVYVREDIPARFHNADEHSAPPILAVAHPGWALFTHDFEVLGQVSGQADALSGMHGYDNNVDDMQAFFLAYGPDFKRNYTLDAFRNVNVYGLIADLLDLTPAPHDGTPREWQVLLRDETPSAP